MQHLGSPKDVDNHLLAALGDDYARLAADLEQVDVSTGQCIFDVNEEVTHAVFPGTAVIALVMVSAGRKAAVEIATIGKEGMVGVPAVLAAGSMPARALGQIAGSAVRVSAEALRREYMRGGSLNLFLHRYYQALFTQAARGAVCNALHSIEERCARWLLATQDRLDRNELPLTQEFLAQMMGVRRASVTVAAGVLQREGFIHYRHGKVTITDRAGLEGAACDCYAVVRDEYARVLNLQDVAGGVHRDPPVP